ncbi:MAG: diaminopimelate epimerase [Bacteroidetes bacterium]|nr:diaminopimelate epimerase [Bacteroidota bacterium]
MGAPQVISFFKYQGTGNDFVMVDYRLAHWDLGNLRLITALCDRKFGIGADGLILIRSHADYDFEMVYFNVDGSQSFCGNGARCAVAFASFLGIIAQYTRFLAIDGPHEARIARGEVSLKMAKVSQISESLGDAFVHTGSPHHVRWVEQLEDYPVLEQGKRLRHDPCYAPGGSNVNFVQKLGDDEIFVRTFERGVENETLSCGTGVTAAALVCGALTQQKDIQIRTLGGNLRVTFEGNAKEGFDNIWLIGPAQQVYAGQIQLPSF